MSSTHDEIIRASEIGLYVFCARAWRLKVEGYQSRNIAEMAAGTESHRAHGQSVVAYHRARRVSMVLLVVALILFCVWVFIR